jgi:steroid delta-isomerase-like uncharacterized protein
MTHSEAQRFFDRWLDAWQRRDIKTLTLDHAEDCIVESPFAGKLIGRAVIENVYQALLKSFPDLAIQSSDLIVEGDRVVQVLTLTGTNTGGFMGLPPTGLPFIFPAAFIYTFRDGQVVHEKRIYDFTGFLVEVGVLTARPA